MIKIDERKHDRLGGVNSLFLSFSPQPEIISIIKLCNAYYYNNKNFEWEVPLTNLAFLLDNLTYYDDITLTLDNGAVDSCNALQSMITIPKAKLFNHQKEAVEYGLRGHNKWLLLDAPGLGKSLSMITLAEELKAQKGIEHCLIICGINSLKGNWEKEISKYSQFSSVIIGKRINSKGTVVYDTIPQRAEQLKKKINEFFVILNVESLRDDKIIDAINKSENKFDMIVLDEAHCCKGTKAQQSKNLLKLEAPYMIAMTGTLLMNNPVDCYIPLAWIGAERKNNVTMFKNTYCIFDDLTKGRIIGYKNMNLLKDEIENWSLRRTKDLLDLPPKNIIEEYVEMDDSHRKFYENVKQGVKEECDLIDLKPNNVLSLVTRLRQATSCPGVLTSSKIYSTKVERAKSLVEEITSQGDKVVIFSTFKEPINELYEELKEYNPLIGTGDIKDSIVNENVAKFQSDNKYKVFVATSQKLGTGQTLTAASYMIFIDDPWTAALVGQCEDRIHRIGSEEPVFIYHLICKDTIDESIRKIVTRKGQVADYIIDDKLPENLCAELREMLHNL